MPNTGGWDNYQSTPAVSTAAAAGASTLYMVFKGSSASLFDLDSFTFGGSGVGTGGSDPGGVAGRTWTVAAQHSGKLIDVSGASTADGAQIVQWAATGGNNQKWSFRLNGTVLGNAAGKCLNLAGGASANGTRIQIFDCNATGAQQWGVR